MNLGRLCAAIEFPKRHDEAGQKQKAHNSQNVGAILNGK